MSESSETSVTNDDSTNPNDRLDRVLKRNLSTIYSNSSTTIPTPPNSNSERCVRDSFNSNLRKTLSFTKITRRTSTTSKSPTPKSSRLAFSHGQELENKDNAIDIQKYTLEKEKIILLQSIVRMYLSKVQCKKYGKKEKQKT